MSKGFIEKARNNFSLILSLSLLKSLLTSLRRYPDMHMMSTSGMKENVISTHPKCVLVAIAKMEGSFNVKEWTTTLDTCFLVLSTPLLMKLNAMRGL